MPKPDRLERLTDLVLVLLNTRRPLTLDAIANQVPGYPSDHDARRQAFERDKRLLRDEGIPVRTEPVDGQEQFGYRIDADTFYLTDLGLDAEEQTALHLAVAGVHLGDPSGRNALLKIGATGLTETRPVASVASFPALVPMFDAIRTRATLSFTYHGVAREVSPARMWFRDGHWYLVGWDATRDDRRTFRVDRIEDWPVVGEPDSRTLPEGFDPGLGLNEGPLSIGDEDQAQQVTLRVDAIEAPRVIEEVGEGAVVSHDQDGSVTVRFAITAVDLFRSWVLGLLDHAEVLDPPDVRAAIVEWLEAMITADRAGAPSAPPAHTSAPAPGDDGVARRDDSTDASTSRDASYRLRRLLAIVSWLAREGEAPIAEISKRFGIAEDELVGELELAACCGLPPYSPDALMEIVVSDETVQAFLPAEMARPRRLTPAEGFALAAAARTILSVPGADEGGALAGALAKLEVALGNRQDLVVELDEPPLLENIQEATANHEQIEIEYHSASSDEVTVRAVDPHQVISLDGHWYVDAWCTKADSVRRFRVDRIRRSRVLGPQPLRDLPMPDVASEAFVPGPSATRVVLDVDRSASWVADSIPALSVAPGADGHQFVTFAVGGWAWLDRLLLQLGPRATVVEPEELLDAAATAAERVLAAYR